MDGITKGLKLSIDKALVFALQLAEKGKAKVEPNPMVGCVLLDDDSNVISYGFHEEFGKAHAEVNAFNNIEQEGLTAVLTLEPCSHQGKTPPCAKLLIDKKIKKLVYIDDDPNPKVAGSGIKLLKDAGIEVIKADDSYSKINHMLNAKFFYFHYNKKTFFHAKWAQTLDGKMSINNTSKWITNEKSREYTQFLRAQSEAILVGKNTVLIDNPSLNARMTGYTKNNKVVILDPKLECLMTLSETNIFKIRDPKDIILVHSSPINHKTNTNLNFLRLDLKLNEEFDLNELKEKLAKEFNIQSLFIEGGAQTTGLFLKSKSVDFVSSFIAPKILGKTGNSYSDHLNLESLNKCFEFKNPVVRTIKTDIIIEGPIDYK